MPGCSTTTTTTTTTTTFTTTITTTITTNPRNHIPQSTTTTTTTINNNQKFSGLMLNYQDAVNEEYLVVELIPAQAFLSHMLDSLFSLASGLGLQIQPMAKLV